MSGFTEIRPFQRTSPVRLGIGGSAMARRLPRIMPTAGIPTGESRNSGTCWRREQSGANLSLSKFPLTRESNGNFAFETVWKQKFPIYSRPWQRDWLSSATGICLGPRGNGGHASAKILYPADCPEFGCSPVPAGAGAAENGGPSAARGAPVSSSDHRHRTFFPFTSWPRPARSARWVRAIVNGRVRQSC